MPSTVIGFSGEVMASRNGLRPLSLALATALVTSGCAPVQMHSAMKAIGKPAEAEGFAAVRQNPLSAAAHYATAMGFLTGKTVTRGDLEMALSGFQTAARLAPDLWEPLAGAAFASYQLGNVRAAMNLMAQAIELRGEPGPMAVPMALLAYRAGEPEFARAAFSHVDHAAQLDVAGLNFLDAAFAGSGWRPLATLPSSPSQSVAPSTDPASGSAPSETSAGGGAGVVIEAYLIRETRSAAGNRGLNLLDGLSVQFGGTLLNYSYDLAGGSADTRTGNFTITAPAINYSLNLASNSKSHVTLEASPLVLAREGHKSKFAEGGSVLIVPLSDRSQPIERDVGVTLEVTPQRIGATDVDLDVVLEMSNITGRSSVNVGRGASVLETDKTHVEVSAKLPYGKAIVVGSGDSLNRRSTDNRSVTPIALPGLSARGTSVDRREVLVVLTVRSPVTQGALERTPDEWSRKLFGSGLLPVTQYGRRPSEAPAPALNMLLPAKLN